MRFGLSVYDITAAGLADLAVAAEAAGFETLWLGEHLLMPVGYTSVHPTREREQELAAPIVGPATQLADPLVALAGAAARTSRLQLGTAIYLLALRHPLAVARAVLTLQDLSAGRLLFGAGVGWLRDEFEALGVPFGDRAQRFDESLDILRMAWAGGPLEYHGSVYDFGPVQLSVAAVKVPLILGGNTSRALRRAAARADGWFASGTPSADDAIQILAQLQSAQADAGRTEPLTTYVRASLPAPADVARYAEGGVSQLVLWAHELCPPGGTAPGPRRWERLTAAAADLGVTDAAHS